MGNPKMPGRGRPRKPESEKAPKPAGGKWKKGGRGRPPGTGKIKKRVGNTAYFSFIRQNTSVAAEYKKKTGDDTHHSKLLGTWWKELDQKIKDAFKDEKFEYVIEK